MSSQYIDLNYWYDDASLDADSNSGNKPNTDPAKYTGLKQENGEWVYYENGVINNQKYGFANYGKTKFLLLNGKIATEVSGLIQDPENSKDWYYTACGQVQTQYTGLAQYDGAWFYVNSGKLDTTMSGYVKYDTGLFFVGAGRIMTEVNGLAQDPKNKENWYYLANGQAQTQHTGLVQYDGAWFYVENGALAKDYTGNVEYDGSTFYVVNGMLQSS